MKELSKIVGQNCSSTFDCAAAYSCENGICACLTTLGFTGDDCSVPSSLTYFSIINFVAACLSQLFLVYASFQTLRLYHTLNKLIFLGNKLCLKCGSVEIVDVNGNSKWNEKDTCSTLFFLFNLNLVSMYFSYLSTATFDKYGSYQGSMWRFHQSMLFYSHTHLHIFLGLTWLGIVHKSGNWSIPYFQAISIFLHTFVFVEAVVVCVTFHGKSYLLPVAALLATVFTYICGILLSKKLLRQENLMQVMKDEMLRIKKTVEHMVFYMVWICITSFVSDFFMDSNGWVSNSGDAFLFISIMMYSISVLNYLDNENHIIPKRVGQNIKKMTSHFFRLKNKQVFKIQPVIVSAMQGNDTSKRAMEHSVVAQKQKKKGIWSRTAVAMD